MTFRIAKTTEERQTVVRIDGQLDFVAIPHLERECRAAEGELVLDLSNVISADAACLQKIRELASAGAQLRGPTRYLQLLLNDQRPDMT